MDSIIGDETHAEESTLWVGLLVGLESSRLS